MNLKRHAGPTSKLGYQAHYVVDGGKARVILNESRKPPGG